MPEVMKYVVITQGSSPDRHYYSRGVSGFKLTKRARLTHCSILGTLMGLFPSKKLSQVGYQSFFLS